ncbi:hypothetical protein [Actinomadura rugatobispora]|uniref:Uncharacterized protein n=1 Tax=Actinomadura rugatobispora TaxID=1994 RepID=A0ABW1ABX6_9ACTN|nr:hypothetical protein GCM10010200_053410 [Actinomadura rugatobispora]
MGYPAVSAVRSPPPGATQSGRTVVFDTGPSSRSLRAGRWPRARRGPPQRKKVLINVVLHAMKASGLTPEPQNA